nr:AsmA-like C-terminal region-containing protein [Mesorhizobium xinjiangense]
MIGYGKVFAGPVTTTLVVAGSKAALTVPQSPFYGGTIVAELSADASSDVPAIKLDMAIADAAAASLLDDATGFNRLEGKLATNVAVSGAGKTTKILSRSLGGTASVKFSDGAVRGIDIAEVYNNLVGLLASGFKTDESKKTTFTELSASFAIDKGIAQTNDISLLGPLVRMDGTGKIDLAEQTLAINLNPRVVASLSGQGGDIAAEGIGVPVIVDGSLSAPRIYPDLSKLLQDPKGALDMLDRLGLPTGKLGLDKLLPGQTGTGETGKGAADLIGDLIMGGGADTSINSPDGDRPRDAGAAAKAIIGDILKGGTTKADPSPDASPAQDGDGPSTAAEPSQDSSTPQTLPDVSKNAEIDSLLDQLLR